MHTGRLVSLIIGSIFFLIWLVSDKSAQTLTEKQESLLGKYRLILENPADAILVIALTLLFISICPDIWK